MRQDNRTKVFEALELMEATLADFMEQRGSRLERADLPTRLSWLLDHWSTDLTRSDQPDRFRLCLVHELRATRNRLAHSYPFTAREAYRALDTTEQVLRALKFRGADRVEELRQEVLTSIKSPGSDAASRKTSLAEIAHAIIKDGKGAVLGELLASLEAERDRNSTDDPSVAEFFELIVNLLGPLEQAPNPPSSKPEAPGSTPKRLVGKREPESRTQPPQAHDGAPIRVHGLRTSEYLNGSASTEVEVSPDLADLLVRSREKYSWTGTPAEAQRRILDLEAATSEALKKLDEDPLSAFEVVRSVSEWGGNRRVDSLRREDCKTFQLAISSLLDGKLSDGLELLTEQDGIDLVMATKIFRFCCPDLGAAVDRHTSHFFNSLEVRAPGASAEVEYGTNFKREWSAGRHKTSRLAVYNPSYRRKALEEYVTRYLPLLGSMADSLNTAKRSYACAVTGEPRKWRPADVEMAAYQYWSQTQFK